MSVSLQDGTLGMLKIRASFKVQKICCVTSHVLLGAGFKHSLFSTLPAEMIHFDKYVATGLKPPTS